MANGVQDKWTRGQWAEEDSDRVADISIVGVEGRMSESPREGIEC